MHIVDKGEIQKYSPGAWARGGQTQKILGVSPNPLGFGGRVACNQNLKVVIPKFWFCPLQILKIDFGGWVWVATYCLSAQDGKSQESQEIP